LFLLSLTALACGTVPAPISTPAGSAASGEQIYQSSGCAECHSSGQGVLAPALEGLYGKEVLLEGGAAAMANEAYLRESILSPDAQTVAGYKPIMPAFQGRLSESEVEALIDYIRSLSG
jgi:cytochrome c oxidase subunit 2